MRPSPYATRVRRAVSRPSFRIFAGSAAFLVAGIAHAVSSIEVTVSGVTSTRGEVGCALFFAPEGFPTDDGQAHTQRVEAIPAGSRCRFEDLPAGRYAISASHDTNGNGAVDTNFFGIPTEAWGVSGGVRPRFRAPTFDEAAFVLANDTHLSITIDIAR